MPQLVKRRNAIYFGCFAAAAASLLPWTAVLAEMLGAMAVFGLILMLLLLVGGLSILKEFRGARFWAFFGPVVTGLLFAIMLIGQFRESANTPSSDVIAILGLPLFFSVICVAIAVVYGAEYTDRL